LTVNGLASFYLILLIIVLLVGVGLEVLFIYTKRKGLKLNWMKVWLPWLTIVGGILVLLVASSVSIFSASSSCIVCHEMEPDYNAWKKSTHQRVLCLSCHSPANNGVSFAFEELVLLREVFNHVTGLYTIPINKNSGLSKRMGTEVCTRCHLLKQPTLTFDPGVKINHEAHRDEGIDCPVCHNRVVHKNAGGFDYLNGLSMMEGCMRCHLPGEVRALKGEAAPTSCTTCHLNKNIAQQAFGKPNPTAADFNNCDACHKLRDPNAVSQFKQSKLFTEATLTCPSCHSAHLNKNFDPKPDPAKCNLCHPTVAKLVVEKKHGEGAKSPFKTAGAVRCSFCHKPHSFAAESE